MEKKSAWYRPLFLTLALVLADQVTKALIVKNIPEGTIKYRLFGDFLYICHVRNTGAAFSLGASSSAFLRVTAFIIAPIVLIAFITYASCTDRFGFTKAQKWFAAGIAGGGIGTIIDRIFRFHSGVVDFISIKFYGLFGLDRWPTFNISDSCVVVFVILFAASVLFSGDGKKKSAE